jgi:hypothetical protein
MALFQLPLPELSVQVSLKPLNQGSDLTFARPAEFVMDDGAVWRWYIHADPYNRLFGPLVFQAFIDFFRPARQVAAVEAPGNRF